MQFETYKEANKTGGNFYSENKTKQCGAQEKRSRQCSVYKIKPYESILRQNHLLRRIYWLTWPTPQRKDTSLLLTCSKVSFIRMLN